MTRRNLLQCTISNTPGLSGALTVSTAVNGRIGFVAGDDGLSFNCRFEDGAASEVRTGCVYTHAGTSVSRGTLESSTTGAALTLTSSTVVSVIATAGELDGLAVQPVQTDITASRALNTTYTAGARVIMVCATVRCAISLAAGNAYVQGMSDTATPPTTPASGIVSVQAGLLNEDNSFQVCFVVAPGKTYQITPSTANGTCTLGKWFEVAL